MSNLTSTIKLIQNIMRKDSGVDGDAQLGWMLFLKIFDTKEEDWEITIDNYKRYLLSPLVEQQRIVAKVPQLQQQLSQLEAQVQQSRRQYAQQLLQSVLREAFEQKGKVYGMEEEVSMVEDGEYKK